MYRVEALQTPVAASIDPTSVSVTELATAPGVATAPEVATASVLATASATVGQAETGRGSVGIRGLKVLLIGRQPANARRIERTVRQMPYFEAQIVQASTLSAARLAFSSDTFDVAILSHVCARSDSATVVSEIAASMGACPVIVVSTTTDPVAGSAAVMTVTNLKPQMLQALIRKFVAG
jgi:hypothetical protein